MPEEPPRGEPDAPPPGGGPQITGPAITLSGTVSAEGWDGAVRLDVFDGDQRQLEGPRPSVVAVHTVEQPGAFEIRVPKDSGSVWVGAFADTNSNGRPDRDDPQAWYSGNPVATAADVDGLVLDLEVETSDPAGGL